MALGKRPPVSTITPARIASSPSFAIAAMSAWGGGPAFSVDLTMIMKRIVISPFDSSSIECLPVCYVTLLGAQGYQVAQPSIAQEMPSPEQCSQEDREDDRKQAVPNADMRGDGAAQVAS